VAGAVLGAATVALPGRTFFVGAWASLQTRTPHMDLPVALGLSVGTVVGTVNAITNRGEVYFDSLAMLVFLLLIGRWIQFRQQHRAANAVDLLLRITPQHARLIDPEEPQRPARWVMVRTLAPGQRIRVHVGESLPVDGRVVAGDSTVDRSLLTGESVPVAVTAGDEVTAGTVNLSRPLEVEVTATGSQSRIGKVMQSVEAAMARRTPIVRLADSVGGVFVVVVTILAAIAFLIWLPHGIDLATAHATSLLIVACPCALALATPLAIAVSLGRAAKRKILIRDGDVLQQLSRGGTAWFDKTGTLTEGRPRAELVHGSPPAVALAAGLEARCCHPIADAIVKLADLLQVPRPESAEQVELSNGGVFGRCGGHQIVVGNETLMRRQGVLLAREARQAAEAVVRQHRSPILIGIDGQAAAVLAISDPLKRDGRDPLGGSRRGGAASLVSAGHRFPSQPGRPVAGGKIGSRHGAGPRHGDDGRGWGQ
jgi:Cu2+-exporting ATPase